MTAIASTDVSYSFKPEDAQYDGSKSKSFRGTISFGNGSLTYPSGGVPLLPAKMGCPNKVRSLRVIDSSASGYLYEYDISAQTLRMMEVSDTESNSAYRAQFAEVGTSEAPAAQVLEVEVKGW